MQALKPNWVRHLRQLVGTKQRRPDMAATHLLRLQQEAFIVRLLQEDRYQDPKHLARFEHQVFSQNGEDGILAEIFRRIGTADKTFLEVAAGSGLENNTVYLLTQGWRGWWVEGGERYLAKIKRRLPTPLADGRLQLIPRFVTAENITPLLRAAGVPREIDLFSLDIDRNTYYIWQALPWLRPRVMVVEYNGFYPADADWKVEYQPDKMWNETTYMGASLKAYELLGRQLGYCLVGCELTGTNAFFVRADLVADHFRRPFTAETHYEPQRAFLLRNPGALRCFEDTSGGR